MISDLLKKARAFEREAHVILAQHETSPSRVVLLDETYKKVSQLSLHQDELFRQALRCLEGRLFRASIVMAWAGFMDYLEEKITSDGFTKLHQARPNWHVKTVEDLREKVPEHQLVEACKDIGLCSKNQTKALLGLLNKRNECAHPSDYFPGLNEALGFISELLHRIEILRPKTL
ncbi:hypothetical protein ES705_41221 [subsurface metagenome]